jgi:hypothetical protein
MIKYFPKNRITTNLYTKGNEFSINGKSYIGAYYRTYSGKVFSGKDPINGSSQELTPIKELYIINVNKSSKKPGAIVLDNDTSDYVLNPNNKSLNSYLVPIQYYPAPTDNDYQKGYIMRYFAKKRNDIGYVIEIDKDTYQSLLKKDSVYDYITYQSIDLFWQITGPLRDNRTNKQYKVSGIIDTNKRLVEEKDKNFRGLMEFIGDNYDKYARPNQ